MSEWSRLIADYEFWKSLAIAHPLAAVVTFQIILFSNAGQRLLTVLQILTQLLLQGFLHLVGSPLVRWITRNEGKR